MKQSLAVLLLLILCCLTFEFASAQGVVGHGSGGGGLRARMAQARVKPNDPPCKDGDRSFIWEDDSTNQRSQLYRVCQNGSYYDLEDYVYNPKSSCRNGRTSYWVVKDKVFGTEREVRMFCEKGQWKRVTP